VTPHTSDLVLEDLVEESSLELSLPRSGGSDITGLLSSSKNDKVLLRGDSGGVEGRIGLVGLEDSESVGLDQLFLVSKNATVDTRVSEYLSRLVLGGGDEVRPVRRHLDIGDLHVRLVRLGVLDELSGLSIVLAHSSVLVSGDDELVQVAPRGNSSLALPEGDGEKRLIRLFRVDIDLDREHNHSSQMTHAHLRHSQQQCTILGKLNALDSSREVPCLQTPSCPHLPQLDCVVGGTGGEDSGRGVDIDSPERTLVAVVGSEALSISYARNPSA
jgi:hypothetical protein